MQKSAHPGFLRFASPNERRCIARENAGFYNALIVGAVYEFSHFEADLSDVRVYMDALSYSIGHHPVLAAVVRDGQTDKSYFAQVQEIDLLDHVAVLETSASSNASDLEAIESMMPAVLDRPWPPSIPPWRIVILPLHPSRCFIAFSYSHSLGDGMSGLAFHRTFLKGLCLGKHTTDSSPIIRQPNLPFPPPFDTPERLPVSWSFLVAPFVALFLPKFLISLFGLRTAASTVDSATWIGRPIFYDPSTYKSCVKLIELESQHVAKALKLCRAHNAKLTGLLHQLIVRALSKAVPTSDVTNFVSGTAVNLRGSVGVSDDRMGLYVSGHYHVHPRVDPPPASSAGMWEAARSMTKSVGESAATLQDQPIGLLRFLPSITRWTRGKIGQNRDSSYELSNLLAFNPDAPLQNGHDETATNQTRCRIKTTVFSQPACVTGALLTFNVVSTKGDSLVCTASWQQGALSLSKSEELSFVAKVCSIIKEEFEALK